MKKKVKSRRRTSHRKGRRNDRLYLALGALVIIVLGYFVMRSIEGDVAGKAIEAAERFQFKQNAAIFTWLMGGEVESALAYHSGAGTGTPVLPFGEGKYGQGLVLDGTTYVEVTENVAPIQLNELVTFAFWARPRPGGTVLSRRFTGDGSGGWKGWDIFIDDSGLVRVRAQSDEDEGSQAILEYRGNSADDWTHYALVINPHNYAASRLYVNAQPFDFEVVAPGGGFVQANVPLVVGAVGTGGLGGTYFRGDLDDLRVFRGSLTGDEVLQLLTRGYTRATATEDVTGVLRIALAISDGLRAAGIQSIAVKPMGKRQIIPRDQAWIEVHPAEVSLPGYRVLKAFEFMTEMTTVEIDVSILLTAEEIGADAESVLLWAKDAAGSWKPASEELSDYYGYYAPHARVANVPHTKIHGLAVTVKEPLAPVFEMSEVLDTGKMTTTVPGVFGRAERFDGVNDIITTDGVPVSTEPGAKTTVEFWMMWDGNLPRGDGWHLPFGFETYNLAFARDGPSGDLGGAHFGFNTLQSDIYGINDRIIRDAAGLNSGWVHVAAVFTNGDVTQNILYINGEKQALSQKRNSPLNTNAVVSSKVRLGSGPGPCCFFGGRLDELKVYNDKLSAVQARSNYNKGRIELERRARRTVPRLLAHYSFEGIDVKDGGGSWINHQGTTVVDKSENNRPGKLYGYNVVTTDGAIAGQSLLLDGQYNYVDLDIPDMASGKPISVSFFMKSDLTYSGSPFGFDTYDLIFGRYDTEDRFGFNTLNSDNYGVSAGTVGISAHRPSWIHVVAVFYDSDIQKNKLYINKRLYSDGTGLVQYLLNNVPSSRSAAAVTSTARIGALRVGLGGCCVFKGLIDEVSIYEGELAQTQVDQLYHRVIPMGQVFYEPFDGRDGVGVKGTAAKFSGGILNYVVPQIDTSDGAKVTVEFWMKWDGNDDGMPFGFDMYDLQFYRPTAAFGFNRGDSDNWGIRNYDDNTNVNTGLNDRGWHHVVAVFTNGNSDQNELYIDGEQRALGAKLGAPGPARVSHRFSVGGWPTNDCCRFNGLVDELRIYNGVLTVEEVQQLYSNGGQLVGVATPGIVAQPVVVQPVVVAPPPDTRKLVAHWTFDQKAEDVIDGNSGIQSFGTPSLKTGVKDKSGNGNDGDLFDKRISVQPWPWFIQGKVGEGFYFQPASVSVNFLIVKDNPSLSSDSFTISAWTKLGQDVSLVRRNPYYSFGIGADWKLSFSVKTGPSTTVEAKEGATGQLTFGWHHVAAVYKAPSNSGTQGELRLYIDGSLVAQTPGTIMGNAGDILVGFPQLQIDDMRIYNYALDADQILQLKNG